MSTETNSVAAAANKAAARVSNPEWLAIIDAVKYGARTREAIRKRTDLPKRSVELGVTALMFRGILTTTERGIDIDART